MGFDLITPSIGFLPAWTPDNLKNLDTSGAVARMTKEQVIAFDGKLPCRSRGGVIGKGTIDMVSAWAAENQLALGQVKVDDKSNEITAIPQLLSMLELSGCIVTIDTIECQTEIVKQIVVEKKPIMLSR